ncbi:MAG: glycine/betaine/sarcosine/D-proline family reductase selenoprotein B [Clostridium sp.]
MSERFKVLYYVNQFFGQVGGEDKADMMPEYREGLVGPSLGFNANIKEFGDVVGTIICGDNYFNENKDEALEAILAMVKEANPDIVVAGPAFNAGRYGMACGTIAKEVVDKLKLPAITGMYKENPGIDTCKDRVIISSTTDSAAGMRKAIANMALITEKILKGVELDLPDVEGYIAQGKRKTVIVDKRGSERAVDMLIQRLTGGEFETELPMPVFNMVDIAPPVKDISKAKIALVTTGGIVPNGNPDKIQSASAQKWGRYDVSSIDALKGGYYTIHGGYDPVYANDVPDRVVPLDILKEYEKEGKIGEVHEYFYTTTGTGTSVANSVKFGKEIGKLLKEAGVDGVILTST